MIGVGPVVVDGGGHVVPAGRAGQGDGEVALPPEKPATCALSTRSARSSAAASSAIMATVTGPSGNGVRPDPRLSKVLTQYRPDSPSSYAHHASAGSLSPAISRTSGP